MWWSESYQIPNVISYVPRRSIQWWDSLVDRLSLVLTLSLCLPRRGTPTPLSNSAPASSGTLSFPFGNLLNWSYY